MYIIFGHMNNLQAIQEGVLSLMQKNVHLVLMNCMEVQKRLHNIVEEFPLVLCRLIEIIDNYRNLASIGSYRLEFSTID